MKQNLIRFENYKVRRLYDDSTETWLFSVVDVIQILTEQENYQAARNDWKVLKNRLKKEESELLTQCNLLKMIAEDGKQRLTAVANPETLLRLIQLIPSSKAEPIKLWLAKTGGERIQESVNP
jgi:DNA-damage-inducible protein D